VACGVRQWEAFALYKYLARAWHMLLVDWLLRTLTHSTEGLQRGLQIAMLAMVLVVVDALTIESLSLMRDVRGYTVFRVTGELQGLGVLIGDGASALGAVVLAFYANTGLGTLQLHSRVTSRTVEVFFVASVNVLRVQITTSGEEGVVQQQLGEGLVCVLAYAVQAGGQRRQLQGRIKKDERKRMNSSSSIFKDGPACHPLVVRPQARASTHQSPRASSSSRHATRAGSSSLWQGEGAGAGRGRWQRWARRPRRARPGRWPREEPNAER
jgi:hypothetical protein